jgi:hypothetical protein
VHPYSLDALVRLVSQLSDHKNTVEAIRAKSHPKYLDRYLNTLGVKTIVAESHYVDRDYLEDFAAYYVRCFEPYERSCARLHFFNQSFDDAAFKATLNLPADSAALQSFRNSYCGFIVIKPLPNTVFGRTCLRVYPNNTTRHFPTARLFSANLFGIPLNIPETLPFQEQDSTVAACATSAIWSALQGTAKEFQHELLTPIEITRAATEFSPAETRMIPNRGGLSTDMMAEAIREVGLEPLQLQIQDGDEATVRAALYAYLNARIPVIMGVALIDTCVRGKPRLIGEHAVAVAGYNLAPKPIKTKIKAAFVQRADRIDKVYAHDDQLGPFARMAFDGVRVAFKEGGKTVSAESMSTTWLSSDGTHKVRALPRDLLIPLYHKIRIPYEDICQAVIEVDGLFKTLPATPELKVLRALEWDIHLTTVNDLKTSLQRGSSLRGRPRLKWLVRSMPRFVWRATAFDNARPVMDVLFDATDIHTSNGVHGVIFYTPAIERVLRLISKSTAIASVQGIGEGALRILSAIKNDRAR